MVYMLRAMKVVDKSPVWTQQWVLEKWDRDRQFPFDVKDEEAWIAFLIQQGYVLNWREHALRYQRVEKERDADPPDKDGLPVFFNVHIFGAIQGTGTSYVDIFPRRDQYEEDEKFFLNGVLVEDGELIGRGKRVAVNNGLYGSV